MRPVTWPKSFRLHTSPTALLMWIAFVKPLADERDAVAIARDLLRSRHPEVDPARYDWRAASVIPREKRAYTVRIPLRVTVGAAPAAPHSPPKAQEEAP
jgi:hypothetical protein